MVGEIGFAAMQASDFAYQRELVPWFRVNENTFDDFMATIRR